MVAWSNITQLWRLHLLYAGLDFVVTPSYAELSLLVIRVLDTRVLIVKTVFSSAGVTLVFALFFSAAGSNCHCGCQYSRSCKTEITLWQQLHGFTNSSCNFAEFYSTIPKLQNWTVTFALKALELLGQFYFCQQSRSN